MNVNRRKTLFDKFLARIKNNPVVAAFLVIGTIVIAVSTFTEATQKIFGLFVREVTPGIAGKWQTEVLTNVYNESERSKLLFEFTRQGDTLIGTVTEMDVNGSNGFARTIEEGKVKANIVSFCTRGTVSWLESARPYKETYSGVLNKNKDEVAFTRLNDLPNGGLPETFVAKRK